MDFKTYINLFTTIPDDEWHLIESLINEKKLRKNEVLVSEGKKYYNEIFVNKGVLRGYFTGPEGEELNVVFYPEGQVAAPLYTRNIQDVHIINYQALTETIVYEFDGRKFAELINSKMWVKTFAYSIVDRELKRMSSREKSLLTDSAEVRYKKFRDEYLGLENEISQLHVASYLGITPVSLSRLRGKFVERE